jgi:uncharacterized membrane protein
MAWTLQLIATSLPSTKFMDTGSQRPGGPFPTAAGVLFGMGLGGFFDGIVLHQILQWHHMLTSDGFPANTLANMRVNVLWDGVFHAATYVFVIAGLVLLWRRAHRTHMYWSGRLLAGSMLVGFGAFNLVEGVVDHHLLGLHHVNETVARDLWIYWDVAFLVWGAVMLIAGLNLLRHAPRPDSADDVGQVGKTERTRGLDRLGR